MESGLRSKALWKSGEAGLWGSGLLLFGNVYCFGAHHDEITGLAISGIRDRFWTCCLNLASEFCGFRALGVLSVVRGFWQFKVYPKKVK